MDRYGKVVEVILLPGTDENGYFDYFANVAKRLPWDTMLLLKITNRNQ